PALRRAKFEGPVVRLLPSFDAFLLGVKDKSHLVDPGHYKRVYRPQGWLSPVVLVDGRVGGVWSHERKGARLSVRVTPFGRMSPTVRSRVRDADRGRLSDGRMHEEDLLDFSRVHVVARAEDHVLLAIDDVEISVLVHPREIAREQPSVAEHRRGLLRLVPVALHDLGTADRELTDIALREFAGRVVRVDHPRVRIGERDTDALLHHAFERIA